MSGSPCSHRGDPIQRWILEGRLHLRGAPRKRCQRAHIEDIPGGSQKIEHRAGLPSSSVRFVDLHQHRPYVTEAIDAVLEYAEFGALNIELQQIHWFIEPVAQSH